MRIELAIIEKTEQYLMGTLSENKRADFELQMNQNAELKSQVDFQGQLVEGIQRFALKSSAQRAYKSYRLKSFLTKALVIGIIAAVTTYAVIKLSEDKEKNPTPTEYNETQTQIIFPENDSLSADANQYLDQEIFKIKTNQDTIIETKDGIVVYVPADAFNTAEPEVDLLIQGAVKTEDILMAGLSTVTADGQELETGGMFYVDAFVNGNRVDLKKELTVDVPSGEPKNGMQLYDGEKNAKGEIVWNNPKPLESFLNPVEITTLDFYPPDYEVSLNEMGYSDKVFMDSLYYSFACEDFSDNNSEYNQEMYSDGQQLFKQNCASCHKENKDMTGPALAGAKERWRINSSEKNYYSFIQNSVSVISSGDKYANDIYIKWNRSTHTPQNLTHKQIDAIQYYVDYFGGLQISSSSMHSSFGHSVESTENVVIKGSFDSTASEYYPQACPGINPASIKTIWNSNFNNTNLATKEFEERMPWIHKTCDNAILELYINNLDKNLSAVDSMAFKYLSGALREKFKEFAARGDGRVELNNQASKKLSAYYEKQQKAITKALVETQENYWNQQYEADAKNYQKQTESDNRNFENTSDIFQKEYKKNLCKVYDELQLNKDCNAPIPPNAITVQVSNLGWKNIDRLVFEATAARETTTFSENGKTATLTYTEWSATISDFQKYDRINVYNIPVEFNSYVKLNGTAGNYAYKLNADLRYQTVALAWTAEGVYFYKADAVTGNSNITLKKVSDTEWRNEIKNSLSSITNMSSELDYTEFMQKDQKRINSNKEKTLLRQKIEPVVFPCGRAVDEIEDTTSSFFGVPSPMYN